MLRWISRFGWVYSGLACAAAAPAQAQAPAAQWSTPQAAAAFGARERILDASISPDGKRIALITPGPKQSTVLVVLDPASGAMKPISSADGEPLRLNWCGWVSNARLLCNYYGISDMDGPRLAYSRLAAMNPDGTDVTPLGFRDRVRAQIYTLQSDGNVVDWMDGSTDKLLLARRYVPSQVSLNRVGSTDHGLGVDLIDTRSAKADRIEAPLPSILGYIADGSGRVRIKAVDHDAERDAPTRGIYTFYYRTAGSNDWKPFSKYESATEQGMYPIAVDHEKNVAYVLKKTDGRDALHTVSLDGSLRSQVAFAHPRVDVGGVVRIGRRGRVIGASFSTEKPEVVYFDPAYARLQTALAKALPKLPLIRFIDSSADEKQHLIFAGSDVDPGRYYLYNSEKRTLNEIQHDRPELQKVALGQVKPITYRAADGTAIPGYLTLPPGSSGKGLKAIVMPHGGPASRDEWGFDWLAQYFVNRGYAVLQPNFRGSSGYGEEWFQENGFKSWRTAIGDVVDAGKWLVSEGIAAPGKLAIVGWSYGGYAALQSNVIDPDLFKAAIAIAPVTDLGMLRDEQKGFTNSRLARDYIGEGRHIDEGSPARHAAKFKAPVLMFHGTFDLNVAADEAKQMDKQLKKAGKKSELVLYPKLDHQLDDATTRADMLKRAAEFLAAAGV